jgi:hypothetical protein
LVFIEYGGHRDSDESQNPDMPTEFIYLRLTTLEPEEGDSSISETTTMFVAIATKSRRGAPTVLVTCIRHFDRMQELENRSADCNEILYLEISLYFVN